MSDLTLYSLWKKFKKSGNLEDAPTPQVQALEYAFKCGVMSLIIGMQDMSHEVDSVQKLTIAKMAFDFGEYMKARAVYIDQRKADELKAMDLATDKTQ